MTIKRKTDVVVPAKLDALVLEAATCAVVSTLHSDAAKSAKEKIVGYLEKNDDGFICEMGKGFSTDFATVVMKTTTNYTADIGKLMKAIKSKEVTIEQILGIASFSGEKLKTLFPGARFDDVAIKKSSESLAITPTPTFKAEVAEDHPVPQYLGRMGITMSEDDAAEVFPPDAGETAFCEMVVREAKMAKAKIEKSKTPMLDRAMATVADGDDIEAILNS